MVIGVCSYGNTGSGALFDMLKEYSELEVLDKEGADFEFKFTYMPDGIEDLRYHLVEAPTRWMGPDMAIKRFIDVKEFYGKPYSLISRKTNQKYKLYTEQFIDEILQATWDGRRLFEYAHKGEKGIFEYRIRMKLQALSKKILKKAVSTFPRVQMYFSYKPENFDEAAKQYIMSLVNCMKKTSLEKTVLDQPFSGDNPDKSFRYYDDPRAIIIDRDPRDLYITAKYLYPVEDCWIPTENIDDFIAYYKNMRKCRKENSENKLYISFEELVYEYKNTKARIEEFLQINTKNGKTYFNPDVSIRNTQLYEDYPNEQDNISKIEKELEEWIFPYDNYDVKIDHTDAF